MPPLNARLAGMHRGFIENVPYNHALGIEIAEIDGDHVVMRLPFDPRWVGNAETGALHGGVITSLLDACAGGAALAALVARDRLVPIATLDLRIDHLRPGFAGADVFARATCYRITRNVAFVRATADTGDLARPLAAAVGTFMLGTKVGDPSRSLVEPPR